MAGEPLTFVLPEPPLAVTVVRNAEGEWWQRFPDHPGLVSTSWYRNGDWRNEPAVNWRVLLAMRGNLTEVRQ